MTAHVQLLYPAPASGDALALNPMLTVQRERAADWATARLWGSTNGAPGQGNRRLVAIGRMYEDSNGAYLVARHAVQEDTGWCGVVSYVV